MRSNHRRHENILPLASLATWIIIGTFACGAGLFYVYCKHQLIARGNQIRTLENELAFLCIANQDADTRIAKLSSLTALRARREMLGRFVPITQEHLISLPDKPPELRAVSNPNP